MTEEGIDYQALTEKLQEELIQARLTILKLRYTRNLLGSISGDTIRAFINKNYVVIVVAIMLLSFIVSSLKMIKSLLTNP